MIARYRRLYQGEESKHMVNTKKPTPIPQKTNKKPQFNSLDRERHSVKTQRSNNIRESNGGCETKQKKVRSNLQGHAPNPWHRPSMDKQKGSLFKRWWLASHHGHVRHAAHVTRQTEPALRTSLSTTTHGLIIYRPIVPQGSTPRAGREYSSCCREQGGSCE